MSAILPVIRLVSAGHHAAVHQQNGSSDPRTLVGCKKENCFCYISRLTNPSQWMESIEGRQNLRNLFLGKKCGVDWSLDYGRSDGIDSDLVSSKLQCKIVNERGARADTEKPTRQLRSCQVSMHEGISITTG